MPPTPSSSDRAVLADPNIRLSDRDSTVPSASGACCHAPCLAPGMAVPVLRFLRVLHVLCLFRRILSAGKKAPQSTILEQSPTCPLKDDYKDDDIQELGDTHSREQQQEEDEEEEEEPMAAKLGKKAAQKAALAMVKSEGASKKCPHIFITRQGSNLPRCDTCNGRREVCGGG